MYTVKFKMNGRFHIEHYDHVEWRDHRAARLLLLLGAVTISKVRA